MPQEICPTCKVAFEVPAFVETLVTCPRCARNALGGGAAPATLVGDHEGTRPLPEDIAFSEEFLRRYTRERVLGTGAFSTVYLARAVGTGRLVAVKFLTETRREITVKRFGRELALLSELRHGNVMEILESGEMGPFPYLVSEYLEGGTLTKTIRAHGRLPPGEAVRVMRGVLAGLAFCHGKGIIHRDMKPDNILFTATGRPKITDLGLAKDQSAPDPQWTAPNVVCGTPHYMAPEQITGEPVGPSADLYACGVVLYEMLAGARPFVGENIWQLLEMQVHAKPKPLAERVPYLPKGLCDVVEKALMKFPHERFATAEEMAAALGV